MTEDYNIRATDLAEKIRKIYEINYIDAKAPIDLEDPSEEDIKRIIEEGNLGRMLHLNFIANTLEECEKYEDADRIRTQNYEAQMAKLARHNGEPVTIHTAKPLKMPSVGMDVRLLDVLPFQYVSSNLWSEPFVNFDGTGICAITDQKDRCLFVNPQFFYGPLMEDFLNQREGRANGDPLLVKKYDWLLRRSFGEANIDKTRPQLKYGHLLRRE